MLKQLYQFCLQQIAIAERDLFRASRRADADVVGNKLARETARVFAYLSAGIKFIFFQFLLVFIELAILIVLSPKEGYELFLGSWASKEAQLPRESRLDPHFPSFAQGFGRARRGDDSARTYEAYEKKHKKARWVSLASFSAAVAAVVAVSLVVNLILPLAPSVLGATYTWSQTNWGGGSSSNNAIHPTNQSAWSQYSSASSEIAAVNGGEDLELVSHSASSTQTTDTQFNTGTYATTTVSGSGTGASVKLTKALHINEYTIGAASSTVSVTVSSVTANSNGTWTIAFSGTPNLTRLFKNDKFTDSASKAWKVLSVASSVYKIIVVDSEGNTPTVSSPVTGAGTVGRWYASISAWEAGRNADITAAGRNAIERGLPYYDGAPDTTNVDISGWTTDSTHYIEIYVPLSERHRGKWNTGKYYISTNAYNGCVNFAVTNLRIDGLQCEQTYTGVVDGSRGGFIMNASAAINDIRFSNNIIKKTGVYATTGNKGVSFDSNNMLSSGKVILANNTIIGFQKGIYVNNGSGSYFIYNNTIVNAGDTGIQSILYGTNDTYRMKNNIIQGSGSADYTFESAATTPDYQSNISQDTTSPNASLRSLAVSFVDSAGGDYHLAFNDTAAKNAGVDLSADAGYAFTTDIDGDARAGTWDIGADDVGATLVMTHSIGTASRDFSTLQAWENARDGVLTTRKVFKISSQSAAFSAGETITGLTSNATGTYVRERAMPSASETYMSLDGGTGTFQQSEVVQGGTSNATATISTILTTAGTIEKGEAYKDSTFTAVVIIGGSTTDATHYMWLTVEPGSRHTGVAGSGAIIQISSSPIVTIANDYTIFDNFEVLATNAGSQEGVYLQSPCNNCVARNNIIYRISGGGGLDIGIKVSNSGATMNIYNNIIYNFQASGVKDISMNGVYLNLYNNTIYKNATGTISHLTSARTIARNNIIVGNTASDFTGSYNTGSSSNNISSDATAPGTSSQTGVATSSVRFISTASDFIDLHILDGSPAKDAGADLSATFKSDIDGSQDRSGTWDIGADEWFSSSPVYNSSGTFTSGTLDFGGSVNFSSLAWNPITQSASTTLNFRIATSSDGTTWNNPYVGSDGTASTYFTTSGAATPSVLNNNHYLRYKAYLSTADSAFSPQMDDATINYSYYATSSPYLTSSPYNSNDATNILGKIAWTATTTSGTEARIQVRSAPNSGGVPGTWSLWCGYTTCDDTDYFASSTSGVDLASGHPLKNGGNDQWLQYKVILVSNGAATPTFHDVTMTYVVNAPPVLQNVTASQQTSDGKVAIAYEVKDVDTATGTVTPNAITPSFQYSTDGGSNWTAITSGYLGAGALTNKTVNGSTFTQYSTTWDAKTQINGTYATNTKIMVSATDNEGANNTVSLASSVFTLDVKNPVATVTVNGALSGQSGATIINSSDNSSYQLIFSNNADFSADGLNASSGQWFPTGNLVNYYGTWIFAASEPVKVSAKFKDAYQNEIQVTPDAPNTPVNVTIQDTSNLTLSEFREFISWDVSAASDFSAYALYRSTDGANYSLLTSITDKNTNFYAHGSSGAWLSNGTTYYYKVVALDSSNNVSRYSSVVSDIPDGQGGTDVTPPTISGLTSSNINTTQATITWTTDELSNSVVYYSTDSSYSSSKTVASMVTAHSATLTGLTPNTAYNFRVRSTDPLGNVSSYATGTPFTTAQGPVISGVTTVAVSGNSATVVWNTNANSDSWVIYSVNVDLSGSQTTGTSTLVGGSGPNYEHRVSLSSLNTNAKYYFKVRSVDGSSNSAEDDNGGSYYTFTTAQDVSAPVISSVSAILSSQTSTVISWLTNEPADSQVIYGLDQSSLTSQTSVNSTMTINHSMILSGLTAGATYYYKVVSADSSANSTQSAVYNFSTTALALENTIVVTRYVESGPPVAIDKTSPLITDVKIDGITESEATITWRTDEEADSFVEYGPPDIFGVTRGQRESVKSHRVVLMDLKSNAQYSFKATSADTSGNVSKSLAVNFKTLSQKTAAEQAADLAKKIAKNSDNQKSIEQLTKEVEQMLADLATKVAPPKITGAEPQVEITSSFATILWATDRPANSMVAFASERDYLPNSDDPYQVSVGNADEQVTNHQVVLSDLAPGILYHYQVRSKGVIGGVGVSSDFTFKTGEEASISGVEIKEVTKDSATILWRTNIAASSLLEYGLSTIYGSQQSDDAFNVSHIAILRNLNSGTFYHFKIGGKDKNNNSFSSPDLTFTTESLPSLLNVKIDSVKEKEIKISWYTDVLADSTAEYTNLKTSKTETFGDKQLVRNHALAVTGLDEDIPYKLNVISKDDKGNEVRSSTYNFQTTRDREAPQITNIQTQSAVSGKDRVQTIVSWKTSEPASSRVTYQEGVVRKPELEKSSPMDNDLKTNHIVVFTDFQSGTVYRLKIESVDASSNAGESRDLTILTPQRKETVVDLIIKNLQDIFRWTDKIR